MAFLDDVVDGIVADIVTIGLATATGEVSGGGYTPLAPNYPASAGGVADLAATLQYSGPAGAGPVTQVIYHRGTADPVTRDVDAPASFDDQGRLDLTSAPVTADFPTV